MVGKRLAIGSVATGPVRFDTVRAMPRIHPPLVAILVVAMLPAATLADRLLIDCPDALRPAMARWTAWRSEQGHTVEWVDTAGQAMLNGELDRNERTRLILVGDGHRVGVQPRNVPAKVVSRYGPESHLASDLPIGESLGAGGVARFPFTTAESLSAYLDRVIDREGRAPGWGDHRLQFTAGVGGFSPTIDAAIEGAAKRLISDLSSPSQEISLCRVAEPRPQSIDRGGVWVWLGHGLRERLPGVRSTSAKSLTDGADFAVLLACYTGDFTTLSDSVAEELLKSHGGPVVVIASTRVSMPYGNARLGGELLSALSSQPGSSIGELFAIARDASLKESGNPRLAGLDPLAALLGGEPTSLPHERWDHAQMYHLLGDPLCVVDRSTSLSLQVSPTTRRGAPISVRGVAPFAGWMRGEILATVGGTSKTTRHERWVRAGEAFTLELAPPETWQRGKRVVRLGVAGRQGLAVGTAWVQMLRGQTKVESRPSDPLLSGGAGRIERPAVSNKTPIARSGG